MQAAKGTAFKFGDDVNTDVILPGKYLNLQDPQQLAQHCMESEDPEFVHKAKPGDIPKSMPTPSSLSVSLQSGNSTHTPVSYTHLDVYKRQE